MKKSIQFILVLSILFVAPSAVVAQDCTSICQDRVIELDGSSDREEIKLNVAENVKKLHLGINSTISSGELTVEIYDPKGNKKGYYSVESQMGNSAKKKESVCGQMHKEIDDPQAGDWIIRLKPKKVKGQIAIHSGQVQK